MLCIMYIILIVTWHHQHILQTTSRSAVLFLGMIYKLRCRVISSFSPRAWNSHQCRWRMAGPQNVALVTQSLIIRYSYPHRDGMMTCVDTEMHVVNTKIERFRTFFPELVDRLYHAAVVTSKRMAKVIQSAPQTNISLFERGRTFLEIQKFAMFFCECLIVPITQDFPFDVVKIVQIFGGVRHKIAKSRGELFRLHQFLDRFDAIFFHLDVLLYLLGGIGIERLG